MNNLKKILLFFLPLLLIIFVAFLVVQLSNSQKVERQLELSHISSFQIINGTTGHTLTLEQNDHNFFLLTSTLKSKDITFTPTSDTNELNGYLYSIRLIDSNKNFAETISIIDSQTLCIDGSLISISLGDIITIIEAIE